MKILMFGRGVISAQYGWALEGVGHQVEFYVRPGRKATYGTSVALDILDARRGFWGKPVETAWPITMRKDLPVDHDYDLIIVSVQHYHFRGVASFLSTRVSNASVLIFNTFWNEPLAEAADLPLDRIVWGFPAAGGGFDPNGVLKGALFRNVNFGTFGTALTERDMAVRALFAESGFDITEHKNFRSWLFIHFAVASGLLLQALKAGSTLRVMHSAGEWNQALLNTKELLPVLQARGVTITGRSELSLLKPPAWLSGFALRTALNVYPPMRLSVTSNTNTEEMKSYARATLREARALHIRVPRLEAAEPYFSED